MDCVLHIDPNIASGDSDMSGVDARIDERHTLLPLLSSNHTNHDALLRESSVVSIETKKVAADSCLGSAGADGHMRVV